MIVFCGWTNNDQTTITDVRVNTYQLTSTYGGTCRERIVTVTEKTLNQLSLERLIKLMFIPVKVPIKRNYNLKQYKLTIRNNLPQRIRINEKNMSKL